MPYYEWCGDGAFHDNRNDRTVEVGEVVELPERVVASHDFIEVDAPDADANPGNDGGETDGSDADASKGDADSVSEASADLAGKHWKKAVSEVEDGEYDGVLAGLAESGELTDSVQDAVEERLSELEE